MVKSEKLIVQVYLLSLLLHEHVSEAKMEWNIEERISQYGDNLKLMCTSDIYSKTSSSMKRYSMYKVGQDQDPLALNGASFYPEKYNATVEDKGFGLIIKNFTEKDLNITYECNYGFSEPMKIILHRDDIFENTEKPGVKEIDKTATDSHDNTAIIVGSIIGVVIIIVLLMILLWKSRKLRSIKEMCVQGRNHDRERALDVENGEGEHSIQEETVAGPLIPITDLTASNGNGHYPNSSSDPSIKEESYPLLARRNGDGEGLPCPVNEITINGENEEPRSYQENAEASISQNTDTLDGNVHNNSQHNNSVLVTSVTGAEKLTVLPNGLILPTVSSSPSQNTSRSVTETNDTGSENPTSEPDTQPPVNRGFQYSLQNRKLDSLSCLCNGKMIYGTYSSLKLRVKSFNADTNSKWTLEHPSASEMAAAGFFSTGYETHAKCFCCGEKRHWNEGDSPTDSRFHRDCSYLEKLKNVSHESQESTVDPEEKNVSRESQEITVDPEETNVSRESQESTVHPEETNESQEGAVDSEETIPMCVG